MLQNFNYKHLKMFINIINEMKKSIIPSSKLKSLLFDAKYNKLQKDSK